MVSVFVDFDPKFSDVGNDFKFPVFNFDVGRKS